MKEEFQSVRELSSNASFKRWAMGEAEKEEALFWDLWIRKSPFNKKLAMRAQAKITGIKSKKTNLVHTEHQWHKFSNRIAPLKEVPTYHKGSTTKPVLLIAAASILVLILAGLFAYYTNMQIQHMDQQERAAIWQTVETEFSEQKKVTLSDGSYIILGPHSSLKYPKGWVDNRSVEVELTGEAYFNITSREENEHEFRVKTTDGVVEVLGTRFVVDKGENGTRVVLEEGALLVKHVLYNRDNEEGIVNLNPNEMVEYDKGRQGMEIKTVDSELYTSWTDNVIRLNYTPFIELVERVQKTFGIEIEVRNPELYERRLSGSISLKNIDLTLNSISEVLNIEVTHIEDTIVFESDNESPEI